MQSKYESLHGPGLLLRFVEMKSDAFRRFDMNLDQRKPSIHLDRNLRAIREGKLSRAPGTGVVLSVTILLDTAHSMIYIIALGESTGHIPKYLRMSGVKSVVVLGLGTIIDRHQCHREVSPWGQTGDPRPQEFIHLNPSPRLAVARNRVSRL